MKVFALLVITLVISSNCLELDIIQRESDKAAFQRLFFEKQFSKHKSFRSFINSNLHKSKFLLKHFKIIKNYWNQFKRRMSKFQTNPQEISVINVQEERFDAIIEIGTPGQQFQLALDTGSSDLWVPSSQCTTNFCQSNTNFNPSASSTFENLNRNFSIPYGGGSSDPSSVSGNVAKDNVQIGNLQLNEFTFGLVTQSQSMSGLGAGGIIGLGFTEISELRAPSIIETLVKQGEVDQAVFSFFLTKQPNSSGSKYIVGGINQKYYTGQIAYFNITTKGWWQFDFNGFSVNNVVIPYNTAFVDSGTPTLFAPNSVFNQLNTQIGVVNSFCTGINSLPIVEVLIQGQSFPLTPFDYVFQFEGQCQNGFSGGDVTFVVLGDSFMKAYYTVFDYGNARIGIAKASDSS